MRSWKCRITAASVLGIESVALAGRGASKNKCDMKSILQMDPRMRELVMLSALAALGCGLAAVQGDLLFVAIFGVTCAVTIIEAIRRLQ